MRYCHNAYPCKIAGATIHLETLPAYRKNATAIARNAAQFLIDQSRSADAPQAFFSPTYYKALEISQFEWNQGKTMTMEATSGTPGRAAI